MAQPQPPQTHVAMSEVLSGNYDTDCNPYASPANYTKAAELDLEARQVVYGLGVGGGVTARGPDGPNFEDENEAPEQIEGHDDQAVVQDPQATQQPLHR